MSDPLELVDVVDAHENVLSVVTKKLAHEDGLLHKVVIGQVIDSRGRWLLVEQASDRQDAGQYVCPIGGHVTSGETNEQALAREAEEELGLTEHLKYTEVGTSIFNREILGRKENHLFIVYTVHTDTLPTLGAEAVHYKYFTIEEIRNIITTHPRTFGDSFYFVWNTFFRSEQ